MLIALWVQLYSSIPCCAIAIEKLVRECAISSPHERRFSGIPVWVKIRVILIEGKKRAQFKG